MDVKKTPSGRSFGILGDSYSTFEGCIPEGNECYYPLETVDDVRKAEDTWWHILMRRNQMRLTVNDSYSGATVCTDVREEQPFSSAFTERAKRSFSGEDQPDYIFIFGGTNDSWLERTIGTVKFANRSEEDLKQVLPAYCEVLEHIIHHNPASKLIAVINTGLHPDIHNGILDAARYYGITAVVLHNIHKQNGHPTALGMRQIAEQIERAL